MGEYEFNVDPEKNRLYMKLTGFFRESESDEVFRAFEAAVARLQPGFTVVNDIRGFMPASPGAASTIRRAGALIEARGVARVIRVAGKVIAGIMQFKRELRWLGDAEYAATVEEADRLLDEIQD